jgi:hypothetical protein
MKVLVCGGDLFAGAGIGSVWFFTFAAGQRLPARHALDRVPLCRLASMPTLLERRQKSHNVGRSDMGWENGQNQRFS